MRCLWSASYTTLPTLDIVCCVLCCAYAPAQLCVCLGGGAYVYACVKCVGCYECVCVMHPPTHCDNLFFIFYLFYQSRLEQFVF